MQSWQRPLLGRRRFAGELTSFEIERFFTLSEVELVNVRSRRNDRHRVAVAIHIGFIRMTGRGLDAFEFVPRRVLHYIGDQLQVMAPDLATLRALYRRPQTLLDHQQWAAKVLGFKRYTEHRQRALVVHLRRESRRAITMAGLVDFARKWLYDQRILIPATRRVLDVVRTAYLAGEHELLGGVVKEVGEESLSTWEETIFSARGGGSILEWLQGSPLAGLKGLRQQGEKITYLKSLGVDRFDLRAVRFERQRHYARQMRRRRPARFRALQRPRRVLEMTCFLRVCLLQTTDTALLLADHLICRMHDQATKQVKTAAVDAAGEYRDILRAIREMIDDPGIPDTELRGQISAVMPFRHELFPSRAATVRWKLAQRTQIVRMLHRLLMPLTFKADGPSNLLDALALLRESYGKNNFELPRGVDSQFAPRCSEIINSLDRRWAFRGFETALLFELRKALRNGAVWVPHSLTYRRRNAILLPQAQWESYGARFRKQAALPETAAPHIECLKANIRVALASVDEAIRAGEVTVDKRGVHLKAIKAETTPDEVERTARALFKDVGTVQFPDLIVKIDNETRFSWVLLGREPTSDWEVLSIYGGLLAHGTEQDAEGVSHMIPDLTAEAIGNSMRLLEESSNLRRGNERVVEFQRRHAVVKHWGEGTTASSDATSIDASRHLWNARVDPKRRRYGIGVYTHVLDQWGIIYDQPIVLTQRQAGAAIEGAVRQDAAPNLERVAVDTHGYTDFGMALCKLVGFDLCPRLRNMRDRRLHVPAGIDVPDSLKLAVDQDVSVRHLEQGWDQLLRVAASVDGGWTSAVLALERFGSASRGDPVHKVGKALGLMLRTVYLCDFFSNPVFRREVLRILDHGESTHTLQRTIYFGGIPAERARRAEELVAISGSLTLLTNLVIAWMTQHIQYVLDDWRRKGLPAVSFDVLRHIAPARSRGINFHGTMDFPLARYRDRLIPAATRR